MPIRKRMTRYHKNKEFSATNKLLLSVDISDVRPRGDTLVASGNPKLKIVNKSLNPDNSIAPSSPTIGKTGINSSKLNNRKSVNKQSSIIFCPEGEKVDFKNDAFAKTHKVIYKAKFNL